MPAYKFVDEPKELYQSVLEYNKNKTYFRELTGNSPKYFVSFMNNGKALFGLSKFCAFKDISVEAYIREFRYSTDGGKTQKHISKLTGHTWVIYEMTPKNIQNEFSAWIRSFFPAYNVKRASFILFADIKLSSKRKLKTSPDELENILEQKKIIGQVGEEIALSYEMERLRNLGSNNPYNHIVHTALSDVAAGYDIFSDYDKQTRMIEVKATFNGLGDIYLTRNELKNFENNPGKAYLYIVHITDIKGRVGKVVKEINDINSLGHLEPILYKVVK